MLKDFEKKVIAVNFEQAELGYGPLSSFLYNNIVIVAPTMDENTQDYVDPVEYYGEAYSLWLKELEELTIKCTITEVAGNMNLIVTKEDYECYTIMYDDSTVYCNKTQLEYELSQLKIPQDSLGGLYVK